MLRDVFGVDAGKPDDDDALALSESERDAELLYVNGLKLLATIVKLSPEWLAKEKAILKQLEASWNDPERLKRLANEDKNSLTTMLESKYLAKCFLVLAKQDRSQVRMLFRLMSVLCKRASVDYTFIREFIKDEVVEKYTPSERNAVLHQLLEEFAEVSRRVMLPTTNTSRCL